MWVGAMILWQVVCLSRTVEVPASADNSVDLVSGEWTDNAGSQTRIRIKGNQHLVALDFDLRARRGQVVTAASLVCTRAAETLEHLTISTIACPWDERRANALTAGEPGITGWGIPGRRFPAVCGGNAFSLVCQVPSTRAGDTYTWDLDPNLAQALVLGLAHGLAVHEASADYHRNPTIWSREAGARGPRLRLVLGGPPGAAEPPTELRLLDTRDPEDLRLSLRAPRHGFAYDVTVNGQALPRWNIPFVMPDTVQTIFLRDVELAPGEPLVIEVVTLSRSGARSPRAALVATLPPLAPLPPVAVTAWPTPLRSPATDLAVIPLLDKYDASGRPVGDLPADYRCHNPLWDGRSIQLRAAAGEVVGFQLLLRGRGPVRVDLTVPGCRSDLSQALYVDTPAGRVPDPLVPLEAVDLSPDHDAVVCADVYVPYDAPPGPRTGHLTLTDGRVVPLHLTVRPFTLPRRAGFLCEMNSYGLPDDVRTYEALQTLAYDHRLHVNILHYSHRTAAVGSRKCNLDMRLASGRRMDEARYNAIVPGDTQGFWDDFAAAFGPVLSGKLFAAGHRGPIPVPGFYLTFHESWPLHLRPYFNGDPDAYRAFTAHPEYAATFEAILGDFAGRAAREGWTGCGLQVYLNNKGALDDPARAPWVLDEPASYWDYRALAYYGDRIRAALADAPAVPIRYRIDISRPQFDRGQLWGKADLWVVNMGAFRNYPRLLHDRAALDGLELWVYGTANPVEQSNRTLQAWVLEAFRGGARGLVPWQTINRSGSALRRADRLGLFILAPASEPDGLPAVYPTLRLKALRRAQQDTEYLTLLRRAQGWSATRIRRFIDRDLSLAGDLDRRDPADAGTVVYPRLDPAAFLHLREAAAALLNPLGEKATGPNWR